MESSVADRSTDFSSQASGFSRFSAAIRSPASNPRVTGAGEAGVAEGERALSSFKRPREDRAENESCVSSRKVAAGGADGCNLSFGNCSRNTAWSSCFETPCCEASRRFSAICAGGSAGFPSGRKPRMPAHRSRPAAIAPAGATQPNTEIFLVRNSVTLSGLVSADLAGAAGRVASSRILSAFEEDAVPASTSSLSRFCFSGMSCVASSRARISWQRKQETR